MKSQKALEIIPYEYLDQFIDQQVHVTWAKTGTVWYLRSYTGENAILETTFRQKLYPNTYSLTPTARTRNLLYPWAVLWLEDPNCKIHLELCNVPNISNYLSTRKSGMKLVKKIEKKFKSEAESLLAYLKRRPYLERISYYEEPGNF